MRAIAQREEATSNPIAASISGDVLSLSALLRKFHCGERPVRAVGHFEVRRGSHLAARLLATLLGLPREGHGVKLDVTIVATSPGEEAWLRSFDGQVLKTRMSARSRGLVAERFGPIELAFRIRASRGDLHFEQVGATIGARRLALPLPAWVAPRAQARALTAVESDGFDARMSLSMPVMGVLLMYSGRIEEVW
jgi:hypothetical protein